MQPFFKQRKFLMIVPALSLALTPYLFANSPRLALLFSAVFLLLFVGITFLTQRQTIMRRLISEKWHKNIPTSAAEDGKKF